MNIEIQGTSEGEGKRERRTCVSGWSLTRTHMLIQVIHFEKALMLLGLLDWRKWKLFRLRCLIEAPQLMLRHINRSSLFFSSTVCSVDANGEENALCTEVHY